MFIISHVPQSHIANKVSLHFTKEEMEGQRWEMIDLRSHSQLVAELSSHQVFGIQRAPYFLQFADIPQCFRA